ncbi:hypothetical protein BJF85_20525 [Saccharomonospora sp. CUA-673]|uniref:hypothetical protein n=1 Tax=Saccharomonospora sp. CUA-673 TaxID=1904969 RepID=UPI000963C0D4|nr:hypothetical protein BJF85_20525 [Saccharomonospora sp. CUA-673]
MVVDAAAFLGGGAGVEDLLDLVEQVVVDQGFVASADLFSLVVDVADVVAVAQHLGELVD